MIRWVGPGALALLAAAALLLAAARPAAARTGFVADETLAQDGSSPRLAVAPNGYAALVWVQRAGTDNAVRVALRPPGGAWSAPALLRTDAQTKFEPTVAVDSAGDAAVSWSEILASGTVVAVASRPAGGAFGAPELLTDTRSTFGAAVGVDAAGQVTLLYSPGPAIAVRDFPAGDSALAATPTPLNASGCGGSTMRLAVGPSGDAVAGYDCGGAVFALRRGGTWAVSPAVADTIGSSCPSPSTSIFNDVESVSIDAAGDAVGVMQTRVHQPDFTCMGFGFESDFYSEYLALPLAGMLTPVPSPFVTGSSLGFFGPTPIVAPQAAVSPTGIVAAWGASEMSFRSQAKVRFFAVDGSGGTPEQPVGSTPSVGSVSPALGVAADGRALLAWQQLDRIGVDAVVVASTRPPGGTFGEPVPASSGSGVAGAHTVALADAGDGAVAWSQGTAPSSVHVRGFDVSAPTLSGVTIPATATAETPAAFAASASDLWGPLTTSWSFGDGASATGAAVQHAYARAGTFTATVQTLDALGNAATRTGVVQVTARAGGAGGGGGGAGGATAASAPRLTDASLTHRTFRVGRRPTPIRARLAAAASLGAPARASIARRRAPVGTTFRFTLDRAANVRIGFARRTQGVRGPGGQCVRPTQRLAGRRRCALFVPDGTLVRSAPQGAVSVPFSGRVGRRALRPGRYRAGLTAALGGRSAKPVVLSFRIVL
jgi:hypothetical protein